MFSYRACKRVIALCIYATVQLVLTAKVPMVFSAMNHATVQSPYLERSPDMGIGLISFSGEIS